MGGGRFRHGRMGQSLGWTGGHGVSTCRPVLRREADPLSSRGVGGRRSARRLVFPGVRDQRPKEPSMDRWRKLAVALLATLFSSGMIAGVGVQAASAAEGEHPRVEEAEEINKEKLEEAKEKSKEEKEEIREKNHERGERVHEQNKERLERAKERQAARIKKTEEKNAKRIAKAEAKEKHEAEAAERKKLKEEENAKTKKPKAKKPRWKNRRWKNRLSEARVAGPRQGRRGPPPHKERRPGCRCRERGDRRGE